MTKVPPVLYKYCPAERLEDILGKRTVRFSQPSAVNDPFDVVPSFSMAFDADMRGRIHEQLMAEANQALEMIKIPKDDPEGLRDFFLSDIDDEVEGHRPILSMLLNQDQDRLKQLLDSEVGIYCLSERNDSILMWAHYADAHTGFAVGFSMSSAFFTSPALSSSCHPQPISYSTNRPTFTPMNAPSQDPFFVKSREWAYEKEWRIVRQLDSADKVIPGTPFPIHLFKLPPKAYHSVIFGCRAQPDLIDRCQQLIQSDRRMQHVQILEAFPAKDRFLLEIRERNWKDNLRIIPL